jgi:2-polyprenyl-6-methoxyphenol hydroxylase-like FAD-dependent oxidoreductase
VVVRDECNFTGFLVDDEGLTVEGVQIRNENSAREEIAAELVVDATGRPSRTPTWLTENGYTSPPVDEVHIDLAYSSIQLTRPPDDQRAYVVMPSPPRKRGIGMFPIEDSRWLMTLHGVHGDHPPTNRDGLTDFAASLPVSVFEQLLEGQEMVSEEIIHYPFPSNRRCCYWDLDRFPGGLVVIGDAIASFNPIYGQGMSVAALEALHLHHALADGAENELALRFFDRIETVVDDAWSLAVGTDFRFKETTGPKPPGTDLLNRYLSRFTRKAHADGDLSETYARVVMMERRPTTLLRPRVVWRVLKPTVTRPRILRST